MVQETPMIETTHAKRNPLLTEETQSTDGIHSAATTLQDIAYHSVATTLGYTSEFYGRI